MSTENSIAIDEPIPGQSTAAKLPTDATFTLTERDIPSDVLGETPGSSDNPNSVVSTTASSEATPDSSVSPPESSEQPAATTTTTADPPAATTTTDPPAATTTIDPPAATTTTEPPAATTTEPPVATTAEPTTAEPTTAEPTKDSNPGKTSQDQTTTNAPVAGSKTSSTHTKGHPSGVPVVTITSSGTIVFTQTYTSYSAYLPTESGSQGALETNPSSDSQSTNNVNKSAIIGGVVGGVGFVLILAAAAFFFMRRKNRRRDNEAYENDLSSYGSPYQNQTNNLSQRGSMSNILAVGAGAGAATGSNSGTLPRHLVAPLQGKNDTGGYAPYPSSGEGGGATDGYYEDISPPYPPNNPGMSGYHPGGYYQDPSGVPMNHSVEAFGPPSYGQFRQVPNEVGYASSEERHVPHLIQNDVPHSRD